MAASDIVHTAKKPLAFEGASTDAVPNATPFLPFRVPSPMAETCRSFSPA